jgi:hypothetical protein
MEREPSRLTLCNAPEDGTLTGRKGVTMTADVPKLKTLAARLEVLADRLAMVEVQVRALMESQTVDAKEFVVRDDRGEIRARLEMQGYSPHLIFYDRSGKERLKIGLRTDATPAIWVEGRETPLEK